jgi:rRNA maturation RNase YbeY
MIEFYSEEVEELQQQEELSGWISDIIVREGCKEGDLTYIFCSDDYLLDINVKYLKHNYLTDVISFDYSLGKTISGDIFISDDRVRENAVSFSKSFKDELHRVMAHGLLHFSGYNDKTEEELLLMRNKEDYYLSLRTF